jgi:phosphatidylserine/phosphatidylglycerophosphate/cardiolipin synthase-like enzyme
VPLDAIFEFSTNAVPLIIKEIASAKKYVRIAMFQIHREEIFNTLNDLLANNVRIEILTLPYDSVNKDIKLEVETRFQQLAKNGATIYFDRWNVGDPKETRTAFGRWYSFHGKFIVTEKSAIALSANFTKSEELDAAIIFRENQLKIQEFNQQFERLLQLFVTPQNNFDGQIREKVLDIVKTGGEKLFGLPENIEDIHKNHWILHYPVELCSTVSKPEDRLYITPFDCRGRTLLSSIIENAKGWMYISTESFTDEDFSKFLISLCINKGISLKIITGARTRDFTDRLENMFRELLTQQIQIRIPVDSIHAKLLITDKALVVSSINLNKMNLGHFKTKKFWRENTESILVYQDPALIATAKAKFEENFDKSIDVQNLLCERLEGLVKDVFRAFQLSPNPETRSLFAKFILKREIDAKKTIIKVGRITKKLMVHYGRDRIEKEDFISALILYHLSESKKDYNQLTEKFSELDTSINLNDVLNRLVYAKLVEKENEYYKINVDALIF